MAWIADDTNLNAVARKLKNVPFRLYLRIRVIPRRFAVVDLEPELNSVRDSESFWTYKNIYSKNLEMDFNLYFGTIQLRQNLTYFFLFSIFFHTFKLTLIQI